MAEVSVTFKQSAAYDAPWIVVKGNSAERHRETAPPALPCPCSACEVSAMVEVLRISSAFSAVSTIAQEFRDAPTSGQAVANIQAALPGTTVVAPAAPVYTPSPPPVQGASCSTCGAPAAHRSGMGANGAWAGMFCSASTAHVTWDK